MQYCKKCLDPDTRPYIKFNKYGVCVVCNNFNKQKIYNSFEKNMAFKNILEKYTKKKSGFFDCIVGVSGGKDSVRQAIWLRDKMGLNPLLICCSYPPEQITELGAKNLSNLINLGFDLIVTAPAPGTWKKILKKGFIQGNYLRGPEMALYASLPQIAIKYKINLIFWGENPTTVWNQTGISLKNEYDGNSLRNHNTLKNCKLDWIKNCISDESELIPYKYPTIAEFKKNSMQIIFLSPFWQNWSIENNAKVSIVNGLKIRTDKVDNTGDLYGLMALDDQFLSINQMVKYYKFGFGRVTEYLNFEIRDSKIKREEAIKIIEKYDGACSDKYIKNFCKYIDITTEEFNKILSKFVNKKLFTLNNNKYGKRYLSKFKVGVGI